MILRNISKDLEITNDIKIVKSFLDQLLGLLRKSNPRSLFFKSRFGIHTLFLKESIDVVVLDREYRVVKIKENLKPNRIFFWNPRYFYVLELPCGKIKESNIRLGDVLKMGY